MALKFPILILMASIIQIKSQSEYCYMETINPYVYFASRTSYFASRGSQLIVPENCEPIYVWGLIRHGTRYPNIDMVKLIDKLYKLRDEIIFNHKKGRGNLCEKDLLNLEKWSTNLTQIGINDLDLTPQGVKDNIFLAKKMKTVFQKLLDLPIKDNFMFQYSGHDRTRDSAIAFSNELLGTSFTSPDGNNITKDGEFLQPTYHCPRNSIEVENNPVTYTEANLFKKSAHFQKIIAEISIRLGYIQLLPYDSIRLMYDMCAYENAWYLESKPPFCAAFSSNELETFDYLTDMTEYYKKGYGDPFSHQIGCPLVRDMLISLQNAAKNTSLKVQKGKFLFSHSETISPVTAKLGLSKDEEPLRHDNFEKMIKQRKWRTSLFNSFAANIFAVLYKCSGQSDSQTKVVIYQNERPAVLSICNNSSFCSLENLQQMHLDAFNENECNLKFCQVSSGKTSSGYSNSPRSILAIICLTVYFLR